MNHPAWKTILYFWHAVRFDERKMLKVLWMYFDDYKEEIILEKLHQTGMSLSQFVRKNKLKDLHMAIKEGQWELVSFQYDNAEYYTNGRIVYNMRWHPRWNQISEGIQGDI